MLAGVRMLAAHPRQLLQRAILLRKPAEAIDHRLTAGANQPLGLRVGISIAASSEDSGARCSKAAFLRYAAARQLLFERRNGKTGFVRRPLGRECALRVGEVRGVGFVEQALRNGCSGDGESDCDHRTMIAALGKGVKSRAR